MALNKKLKIIRNRNQCNIKYDELRKESIWKLRVQFLIQIQLQYLDNNNTK